MSEETVEELDAEEIIEQKIVEAIAAVVSIPVDGLLTPAPEGVAKFLPGSNISVAVDLDGQQADRRGPGSTFAWLVQVVVRVDRSADKNGALFAETCRRVKRVLLDRTGDLCAALSEATAQLYCDGFMLGATQTRLDDSTDGGSVVKVFTANLTGRHNTNPRTENDHE